MNKLNAVLAIVVTLITGCNSNAPKPAAQVLKFDWHSETAPWIRNSTAKLEGLKESAAHIWARDGQAALIVWTSGFRRSWHA